MDCPPTGPYPAGWTPWVPWGIPAMDVSERQIAGCLIAPLAAQRAARERFGPGIVLMIRPKGLDEAFMAAGLTPSPKVNI